MKGPDGGSNTSWVPVGDDILSNPESVKEEHGRWNYDLNDEEKPNKVADILRLSACVNPNEELEDVERELNEREDWKYEETIIRGHSYEKVRDKTHVAETMRKANSFLRLVTSTSMKLTVKQAYQGSARSVGNQRRTWVLWRFSPVIAEIHERSFGEARA